MRRARGLQVVVVSALVAASSFAAAAGIVGAPSARASTSDWTLRTTASAPSARSAAAMAYDVATGQTLLFGGTTTTGLQVGGPLADTWSWDGSGWHQLHPAVSPPALQGAAMAYDPDTRQLVLFGGASGNALLGASDQTWLWNGVTWKQASPASSPPAVAGATMAFDAATDQLVLTGGSSFTGGTEITNEQTWVWDGASWQQQEHAVTLSSFDVTMAYDAAHSALVLVQEGIGANSATWVWNGDSWYQQTGVTFENAPPSRDGAVLVYSPAAQELVLEGGQSVLDNFLGDVWVWGGSSWTQRTDGSPYPAAGSSAALDSAGQLVVFGGLEGDVTTVHAVSDTWVYTPTRGAALGAPVTRVAGADRDATAIAASQAGYPATGSASAAVLARNDLFADALAGGPLAAHVKGPLLLTPSAQLDPAVATELSRVLAPGGTVYLLGGTSALSAGVATAVQQLGFTVSRLAGADRYATASAIADALGDPATVFEASGTDFPDALAAVPAAIVSGGAILLTAGSAQAAATSAFLTTHTVTTRYAVGGPAAAADPAAVAVVGADRYATSAQLAAAFFPAAKGVDVASGTSFPDALAGGPLAGVAGEPMLLVPASGSLPEPTSAYLALHDTTVTQVRAFGGAAAVSDGVLAAVTSALSTN